MSDYQKALAALGVAAGTSLLFTLWRHDLFHSIRPKDMTIGPLTILVVRHTGPYKDIGGVFDKLWKRIKNSGILPSDKENVRSMAIYYDNPNDTPASECRTDAGVILNDASCFSDEFVAKILKSDLCLSEDLPMKVKSMGTGEFAGVDDYPLHGCLTFWLGISRIYPRLQRHLESKPDYKDCQEFDETTQGVGGFEIYDWCSKRWTVCLSKGPFPLKQITA